MSQETAAQKAEDRAIEYIPFGSDTKIKLSIAIVRKTIANATKSGKMPNDAQMLRFIMMCQAQRLNPYAGDAYLIGYDGKNGPEFSLITAHQALLKRAEVNDNFLGMQSGIIIQDSDDKIKEVEGDFLLPDQVLLGAWAKVYHAKRKDFPFYRRQRLERYKKEFGQWLVDPAGMCVKCVEADALRSAFPTMLGGLYISEERSLPVDISSTVTDVGADELGGGNTRSLSAPQSEAETAVEKEHVTKQAKAATPSDARTELQTLLDANGIPFNFLKIWADETGAIPNSDSCATIAEMDRAAIGRIMGAPGAKKSMLDALLSLKAQGRR